jgi:hypothetical protein
MKKLLILITCLFLFSTALRAQDLKMFSPGQYKLTPCFENGLWGYKRNCNINDPYLIKRKFEIAAPFYSWLIGLTWVHDKLAVAKYKNKWVIINIKGKIKKKLNVDEVSLKHNTTAWIYRKGEKYGVILKNGKIASKAIYDFIIPISESKYNNRSGKVGSPGPGSSYNEPRYPDPKDIDMFFYKKNDKVGIVRILNPHDGYKSNYLVEIIPEEGYYQFYNKDMTPIDLNNHANSCDEWGSELNAKKVVCIIIRQPEKRRYIVKGENLNDACEMHILNLDSIAPTQKTMFVGDKLSSENIYFQKLLLSPSTKLYQLDKKTGGVNKIKKDGKWGVTNSLHKNWGVGNINYAEIKYDSISDFGEYGVTAAILNGKSGVINQYSDVVIDFKYNQINPLGLNYFALEKDAKWGISYLDVPIFETNYDDFKQVRNLIYLKKGDYWGVFKKDGKKIFDFRYNTISKFETIRKYVYINDTMQFAKVSNNNKIGLIDINYQEVLPPIYDEIIKIGFDTYTNDTMVYVKVNNRFGCVDIDKSTIIFTYYGDSLYYVPVIYSSIKDVDAHIQKNREVYDLKRQKLEQARVAEEKRQEKLEQERVEQERVAEVWRQEKLGQERISKLLDDFREENGLNNSSKSDCEIAAPEFEKFVKDLYSYCNSVKNHTRNPTIEAYVKWENEIRLWNDKFTPCLIELRNNPRVVKSFKKYAACAGFLSGQNPSLRIMQ